jgi:hypothetical protein
MPVEQIITVKFGIMYVAQHKCVPVSMTISTHTKNSVLTIISQPTFDSETDGKTAKLL